MAFARSASDSDSSEWQRHQMLQRLADLGEAFAADESRDAEWQRDVQVWAAEDRSRDEKLLAAVGGISAAAGLPWYYQLLLPLGGLCLAGLLVALTSCAGLCCGRRGPGVARRLGYLLTSVLAWVVVLITAVLVNFTPPAGFLQVMVRLYRSGMRFRPSASHQATPSAPPSPPGVYPALSTDACPGDEGGSWDVEAAAERSAKAKPAGVATRFCIEAPLD